MTEERKGQKSKHHPSLHSLEPADREREREREGMVLHRRDNR